MTTWPFAHARWRGDAPSFIARLTSAPRSRNRRTASTQPVSHCIQHRRTKLVHNVDGAAAVEEDRRDGNVAITRRDLQRSSTMELLHPVKIGAIVEEKRRYVRVTLLARDVQGSIYPSLSGRSTSAPPPRSPRSRRIVATFV
mmetsp:Transcript_32120/g.99214  ORF Transcript_32120/g.99214 Transcript_32120/m.99214 type:complete len:142 (-) Transcript_32120:446-871(-)